MKPGIAKTAKIAKIAKVQDFNFGDSDNVGDFGNFGNFGNARIMKPLPVVPEPAAERPAPTSEASSVLVPDQAKTEELKPLIIEAISTVFDPEIPVNIWELGLVYDIAIDSAGNAAIRMTLTAPGCPAAQSLPIEVASKVKAVPGVSDANVDVVWEPAWTKDRMSDAAKLQLGIW